MHKVCDKCYQRIEDANINKLVFKRDSEKCSVDGCNKPFNLKTKKVSKQFNLRIQQQNYCLKLFYYSIIVKNADHAYVTITVKMS